MTTPETGLTIVLVLMALVGLPLSFWGAARELKAEKRSKNKSGTPAE